jgi:hypothetical protein
MERRPWEANSRSAGQILRLFMEPECSLLCSQEPTSPRPCDLLALRPTPRPPFVGCPLLLIQYIRSCGRLLHTRIGFCSQRVFVCH